LSRAQALADKHGVQVGNWAALGEAIVSADIVISSTSAEQFIITKEMLEMCQSVSKSSQKVMIDIAVPRDIEPEDVSHSELFIYDV
ncbi:glutamyl-tRNA reductase, partial [Staphylococcus epidermidis]